ncbi:MAG: TetR family transcriptional regulator [Halobacteriovoraceae bacterium]|nr:TetR family transcriptional regulator [Halobacteriovoraceae bacterium]|tara:strand:+ start:8841 stop:9428 length:588 start_codon:yes stop_codon:yes gene_type:complete
MSKGLDTKETILRTACELSSKFGFEALSIGKLATKVGLSKSGLFGHFNSKEQLQIDVLNYTAENFTAKVLRPAVKKPRGLARVDAIIANWLEWSKYEKGGCPLLAAAIEFDDRPGEIRKVVRALYEQQINFYKRAFQIAVECGELPKDTDINQIVYEFYSLLVGQHIYTRLLKDQSVEERLLLAYEQLKAKFSNP